MMHGLKAVSELDKQIKLFRSANEVLKVSGVENELLFNIVSQSDESTVVTEYKPQAKCSEVYQSEADLEKGVYPSALRAGL